ncbi:hypothetical protein Tco_1202972 [Tanacetum coccineum]
MANVTLYFAFGQRIRLACEFYFAWLYSSLEADISLISAGTVIGRALASGLPDMLRMSEYICMFRRNRRIVPFDLIEVLFIGFMDSSHSNARSSVSQNSISSNVGVESFVPSGIVLNAFTEEIVAYEKESDETHAIKKLNALCTPKSFVTHSNFDTPSETIYYIPKVFTDFLLVQGNVYDSVDDCVVAYMKYATEAEFADEVSKYNYKEFGNVVSFDATFKTNKFSSGGSLLWRRGVLLLMLTNKGWDDGSGSNLGGKFRKLGGGLETRGSGDGLEGPGARGKLMKPNQEQRWNSSKGWKPLSPPQLAVEEVMSK